MLHPPPTNIASADQHVHAAALCSILLLILPILPAVLCVEPFNCSIMAPHPWASTPAQRDSDQPPRPITRSSGKAPEIPATPIATRVRRKGGQRRKPSPSDGQDTTVAPPKPSKPKPATLQEGEQCAHTSQPTMAVSDDRDMANLQPYEAGPPSDSISLHAVFPLYVISHFSPYP